MRTLAVPVRVGGRTPLRLLAATAAFVLGGCVAQAQQPAPLAGAVLEKVAEGFGLAEAPKWHEAGYLLFVDVSGSRIHRWTPAGGVTVYREPSGRANGIAIGVDGSLIVTQRDRRVSRITSDGREIVLAERYQGKRLNSPNDLALRPDGTVYFTDPPFGVSPDQRELGFNGVYRLSPDGTLQLLVDDFTTPNGIVFSPDGTRLYVADSAEHHVRVFDVRADGTLTNGRVFATLRDAEATGDPDGMTVDRQGNLYVAGPGGVWAFSPAGDLLHRVHVPEEHTTNLTWGDADQRTLYVTTVSRGESGYVGSLYRLRLGTAGH